jgi:hypothetical protein
LSNEGPSTGHLIEHAIEDGGRPLLEQTMLPQQARSGALHKAGEGGRRGIHQQPVVVLTGRGGAGNQ